MWTFKFLASFAICKASFFITVIQIEAFGRVEGSSILLKDFVENKDLLNKVNAALDEVREFIKSDGGDIELVKIKDKKVYVRLKGACVGCPLSMVTLQMGVLEAIQQVAPEIEEVVNVDEHI